MHIKRGEKGMVSRASSNEVFKAEGKYFEGKYPSIQKDVCDGSKFYIYQPFHWILKLKKDDTVLKENHT